MDFGFFVMCGRDFRAGHAICFVDGAVLEIEQVM